MPTATPIHDCRSTILQRAMCICPLLFSKLDVLAVFSGPVLLDTQQALDGRERRAQLVASHGQEIILEAAMLARLHDIADDDNAFGSTIVGERLSVGLEPARRAVRSRQAELDVERLAVRLPAWGRHVGGQRLSASYAA